MKTDFGTVKFPNLDVYEGGIVGSKKQGENGKYKFINGDTYEGEFRNDL
jgi:hypothetical protein